MKPSLWELIADSDVEPAHALLGELEGLLEKERVAVGRLAADEVASIGEAKLQLVDRFRMLNLASQARRAGEERSRSIGMGDISRARLRDRAERVLFEAEANALLLADVVAALSGRLGLGHEPGTYDARARVGERDTANSFTAQRA